MKRIYIESIIFADVPLYVCGHDMAFLNFYYFMDRGNNVFKINTNKDLAIHLVRTKKG